MISISIRVRTLSVRNLPQLRALSDSVQYFVRQYCLCVAGERLRRKSNRQWSEGRAHQTNKSRWLDSRCNVPSTLSKLWEMRMAIFHAARMNRMSEVDCQPQKSAGDARNRSNGEFDLLDAYESCTFELP